MGRAHKDRHDMGDIGDDLFNDYEDDDTPVEFPLSEPTPIRNKRKSALKKAKHLGHTVLEQLDDWQDPEDDLMYGFKE